MSASDSSASKGPSILGPALLTLAITALRLTGELNQWNPKFFNRDPGGPLAVIGIVWLVPIFGAWFALKLRDAGRGPRSPGRAIGFAIAGIACAAAVIVPVGAMKDKLPMVVVLLITNLAASIGAIVAFQGWKELGRKLLAYGLAARIPVAIVMYVAMKNDWGTHYDKGPPKFEESNFLLKWLEIGLLPQVVFWVAFTIVAGMLVGGLASLCRPRRETAPAASR